MSYERYLDVLDRLRARWSRISLSKKRWIVAITVFVVVAFIVALEISPFSTGFVVGKPSPRSIRATRTVQFKDNEQTRLEKAAAAAAVKDSYDYNTAIKATEEGRIRELFSVVDEVSPLQIDTAQKVQSVNARVGPGVTAAVIESVFSLTPEQRKEAEDGALKAVGEVLDGRITDTGNALAEARVRAARLAGQATADPAAKSAAEQVATSFIEPDATLNVAETNIKRKAAADAVKPVVTTRNEGEFVVRKGENVTPDQLALLKTLGFASTSFTPVNLLLTVLFTLAIFLLSVLYMYKEKRNLYDNPGLLVLLGGMVIIYAIVAKTLTIATTASSAYWGYLMPTAAVALITAVLFDTNVSVMMVIVCSLITGIIYGGSFTIASFALVGGLFPALMVTHLSNRHELRRAGLYTSFWLAFVAFSISLLSPLRQNAPMHAAVGFLNGAVCGIVAMGALPFLETTFRVTTNTWLLELASPEQDLLKDLSMKAPGTYSHSVMTANLSEAAARLVGSDPLLARVAAYYHDIGKMKRPQFFVENQGPGENPHDKLSPNLSALIIVSHVKDGVEILEKNHIPPDLVDIIKQHHGNTLVTYFYEKALESKGYAAVEESRFRYHFDRPKRRTAGILMLADSVEAAARTLDRPSAAKIEQVVDRVMQGKLDDGQLDDCELTFNDLSRIREAFLKILVSAYHPRVDYPLQAVIPGGKKKVADKGLGGNVRRGKAGPAKEEAPGMVADVSKLPPGGA